MIQAADSIQAVTAPVSALNPLAHLILLAVVFLTSAVLAYKGIVMLAARGKDDRGAETSWALLKTFPSTNGIIVTGIALAAYFVIITMVADMIGRPVSQMTQTTLSFFIAAMLGIGAGQFAAKRATDSKYQEAKNAHKGVTVNTPEATLTGSPVNVEEGK